MQSNSRILIVEDETDLAELIAYNLRRAGHEADIAHSGEDGLRLAIETHPDLVILDLMLPTLSGLDVARRIRSNPKTSNLPIIMLTAKASETDQVQGLQVGADDYVTKPFSPKVLLARVTAALRRSRAPGQTPAADQDRLAVPPIEANLATHEVMCSAREIKLTLTEFRLLVALMRRPGKVIRRADLIYSGMGPDVLVTPRTIDVHIAAIRRKLGSAGNMIRTTRGVGYMLAGPARRPE